MGQRKTVILTQSVTGASYAQFKHRTSHVPNLIPPIKYMKRLMFESIKSNMWVDPQIEFKWPKWEF